MMDYFDDDDVGPNSTVASVAAAAGERFVPKCINATASNGEE